MTNVMIQDKKMLYFPEVTGRRHGADSKSGRSKMVARLGRLVAVLMVMIVGGGSMEVKATDYVIAYPNGNNTYYLGMNGNSLQAKLTFDPTCIWTCRNGNNDASLGSTSYSLRNKNNTSYFLTTTCTRSGWLFYSYSWSNLNVQTSANDIWRSTNGTNGNVYAYNTTYNRSASINFPSLSMADNNTSYSYNYLVTSAANTLDDQLTAGIAINSVSGNKITFEPRLSGYYVPANTYTIYTFNSTTHNYYNNQDYGAVVPDAAKVNASSIEPTYTWSLTANGGGVATINSENGELTLSGAPTGNITVRLTVSGIGSLANKTVDYTLTRAAVAENVTAVTTLSDPVISPTSISLDYQGSQAFTGSATASTRTTTIPAHVTLSHDATGTTYYYYNGALYTTTDGFRSVVNTTPTINYSWSLSGPASSGGHLAPTSGTGSSITISYPNISDDDKADVLTLTATAAGETKTATTTVTAKRKLPTGIAAQEASLTICQGSRATIHYTLDPAGSFNAVLATSADEDIAAPYVSSKINGNGEVEIAAGSTLGTTTITLRAIDKDLINPGDTYNVLASTTVSVTTQEAVLAPTITFDNTTNEVTISSATSGATIYYSTNGRIDEWTYNGTTPITFTIAGDTPINATAMKDGLCNTGAITTKTIEKLPTPTITVGDDGKVMMTCDVDEASIYYTTDGSNPTAASTPWNSNVPITLGGGSTVKAIAIETDYINSDIASSPLMTPAATPLITIASPSGSVTITCGTAGATIYYTTDGSDPTTSSSVYSGAFTVDNGVTVKAIAVATGYAHSEVASERFMLDSDVSGSVVTINDYEDHNWSYYQPSSELPTGYPDELHSAYPRNVKITYYGNGTNTVSTTDGATPANNSWTAHATGVKVGIASGENQSTFIYYKTLERDANNRFPYELIPNPFSVRPTYSSGDSRWRGFYKWRVKSITNGAIYNASGTRLADTDTESSDNVMLDAETTYYFQPTDNAASNANNATSMEVELEALWARAYVVDDNNTSNGNVNVSSQNVGYERNFVVLRGNVEYRFGGNNGRRVANTGYDFTVTSVFPNGTSDGTNTTTQVNQSSRLRSSISLGANTKIENIRLVNSSYTINAASHDLIIGRGVTPYSGSVCASNIFGITGSSTTNLNYKLRIESGTYTDLYFAINSANALTASGSDNHINAVLGNDYDRANNEDNSKLTVTTSVFLSSYVQYTNQDPSKQILDVICKSGRFLTDITDASTTTNGGAGQCIYLGENYGTYLRGKRRLTIEGGNLFGIAGATDASNNNDETNVIMRIKGGTIRGSIYGAAARLAANGNRLFIITGGTINGWVAGGCNGVDQENGIMDGISYMYIGGNTHIEPNNFDRQIGSSKGGNVFGAGSGIEGGTTVGQVNTSYVAIADNSFVAHNVFGGGNYGYVNSGTDHASNIYILGGTIGGAVYGGSNQQQGQTVNITMKDGTVKGGIYGGSNITGTINNDVTMNINGGQVGTETTDGVIHGGGLGNATRVLGSVNMTIGASATAEKYVTVYGDVYGGSAQGKTNGDTDRTTGAETNVTLNKGVIHGSLYGGGLGNASYEADVYGPVTVTVNGGSVTKDGEAGVFGCNNVNGAPQSTVTVTVTGTDDAGVDNVFGGGNHADYPALGGADYPTVTMSGGTVNNSVFGGGNEADIKGNANVTITGGTVTNRVFGGGNLGSVGTYSVKSKTNSGHTHTGTCIGSPDSWSVGGKCTVSISGGKVGKDGMRMPQDYGFVFGASRGESVDPDSDPDIDFRAYVRETDVTISGTALIYGGVYGGSENGHVRGNTYVKIQGGQIGCGLGKTAAYTNEQWTAAETAVKAGSATGIESAAAAMPECPSWRYQNPHLPYDANNATDGGATTGSDGHTFYGNVFGGGSGYWPYEKADHSGYEWNMNAGLVEGNTKVEITGGHILTSVYGGNELTNVTGDCEVIMTGGTLGVPRTLSQIAAHPVTCYLFGAGKGDQRTHFNMSTNVRNVHVKVGGAAMIYGSIFGGGEDGHATGNASIEVEGGHIGTWGTSYVDGNVFGAGRGFAGDALTAGVVQGNVTISISGGTMLGSVYGGGRLASVGTYLVDTGDSNYGKLMGSTGDTDHGNITINISGGTIGNSYEYIVPATDWTPAWKNTNHIPYTEFGSTDTDKNRLTHTKGGNVFAGCMGRLYKLNGVTPISNWPDLGKVRKTVVNISGGTIKSNVYGGGELGIVDESTKITITGGTIGTEVNDNTDVNYTYGSVFGGGYGSEDNMNGTVNDLRSTVNSRNYAGLVKGSTDIDINEDDGATRIWASVYGGGELAIVNGSTDIAFGAGKVGKEVVWQASDAHKPATTPAGYVRYGGYRMGNIFGGGKGSLNYVEAGHVKGNTTVTISGGNVYHNVYGGGALGSVGNFTFDAVTNTTSCAANTGTTEVTITGGQIGINGYDNGMVNGSSRGAEGHPHDTNIDRVAWVNNSIVKIGTEGQGTTLDSPIVKGSIYGGGENGHNYATTQVDIYSGTVGNTDATGSSYEHGNVYGAGCGTDTYTYDLNNNGTIEPASETFYNPIAGIVYGTATVNVKGGKIVRNVYGGGALGSTEGKATVNITGGRIGNIYGGPKGMEGGHTEHNEEFAYCGNDIEVNIQYASTPTSDDGSTTQLITGSVYGGGEAGNVKGGVVVNMKNGRVLGDLYGGGALADTNIGNATNYGAANESITSTSTNTTTVNLHGGTIDGSAYGGGLGRKNGFFGATSDKTAVVYGDVTLKLNETVGTDKCWVKGTIFGCNNLNGTPKGHALVHIYKTVTKDSSDDVATKPDKNTESYELAAVYGGGNMAAYEPAGASDKTEVIIEGCDLTSIETVYGGGNAASTPATEVTVNSCYEIGTIFGGGNGRDALPNGTESPTPNPGANVGYMPNVDETTPGASYGTGTAAVNAYGGTIHKIYGGSNTKGNVRHESVATVNGNYDDCPLVLGEVFGGGNEAYMDGSSSVKLGCIDYLQELYGGANAADVGGDIVLTITSGRFDRVFGGNNQSGTINGSITVNVEETGCHPIVIGELYGCGNQAPYTTPSGKTDPTINVKSFTSIGTIYGGGLGATAIVRGNPTVNVNEVLGDNSNEDVATGAYNYYTTGTPTLFDTDGNFTGWTPTLGGTQVTVPTHDKGKMGAIGTIFGGGNAAEVRGNTNVNIGTSATVDYVTKGKNDDTTRTSITVLGADIRGNVFGGGNAAEVTGNTNVNIGR